MVKAKCKETGTFVAIKQMENVNKSVFSLRMAIREIGILNSLTKMNQNKYSTKLYATRVFKDDNKLEVFLVLEFLQTDLKSILMNP